ncbi:hypothetical protein CPC735_073440 [Coccidioides posadasii C735 delta SOWgp]|uniref:Uncharacterized protein n=1 Tax=Coccidioides posadasii (strain C735) TaxID=222929 RepID=C5P017_COCP7|nr:hypothetical protein CPC735_073440 [Coccidioides posadasii C735 delta SOWgp]EER29662.1 hypothetical protein CPC735_073440 [Coccidioides posadasii C735 delta SOWgp]|eukprot:XP_003071807.1 hypothetical protein CPC735_073440 [Coccidioides posadasii C735 delta SOWgp]
MDSGGSQVPDLASVLKTLSSFVPAQARQAPDNRNENNARPRNLNDDYDPLHFSPLDVVDGAALPYAEPPSERHQYPSSHSSTPAPFDSLPDPSSITAWPAALKFVMKTVAQNEAIQSKIRRLIRSQHGHEKKWWEAREALLAKQKTRAQKKEKLDEVLRSVGGAIMTGPEMTTPAEDAAEVETYDRKVYSAMSSMSRALDAELRELGIPFFAIRHGLVHPQSTIPDEKGHAKLPSGNSKDNLSMEELRSLQKRMFDLLEDLCKE